MPLGSNSGQTCYLEIAIDNLRQTAESRLEPTCLALRLSILLASLPNVLQEHLDKLASNMLTRNAQHLLQ